MSKTQTNNVPASKQDVENAEAIKACLNYLEEEAFRAGLHFSAHLIGVAAGSVSVSTRTPKALEERRKANGKTKRGSRSQGQPHEPSTGGEIVKLQDKTH